MKKEPVDNLQKNSPVARVNNTIISEDQLETGLDAMLEPYKDIKGKVRLTQQERYAARKQTIDNLIMRELLYQEGCRCAVKAKVGEIDQAMELSVKDYDSEQEFEKMLALGGSSLEEFRKQLKRDIIINKMAASVVEDRRKPVTPEAARKYYDEHQENMRGSDARKILHIMTPLDRYASAAEEEKGRKKLGAINLPEDFKKIVKQGPSAKSELKAEDLGFVTKGQFHPLLESIAFRLEKDVVSRIVRTDQGLHRLLVNAVVERGEVVPFDLVEEEIKAKLYETGSVSIINEFTEKLKKNASIIIYDKIAANKLAQELQ